MKQLSLLTAAAFSLMATAAPAGTLWGVNPNSCTPSGSTIAKRLLRSGVNGPQFATDKTGTITLFCPVLADDVTSPEPFVLRMTYEDTTGTGTGANVRADLFSIAHGDDFSTNLLSVNSDADAEKDLATLESSVAIMEFDFESRAYWVRIILKRSKPTQTVRMNSVFIESVPP